jgi:hypothetical protein
MDLNDLATQLKQEIMNRLGSTSEVPSGWQKQNCKLCHHRGYTTDKRQRFGIRFDGDVIGVNCFNCKFSAKWEPGKALSKNFQWFLTTIGMSQYDVKRYAFEIYRLRNDMGISSNFKLQGDITSLWKPTTMPPKSQTLQQWAEQGCTDKNFIKAIEYFNDRGLLYPNDFYWSPAREGMMYSRILIPLYYANQLVGYTGRYIGTPKTKEIPRYFDNKPTNFIYGLDNQTHRDRKYIILVEGILDAYLADGISPLGGSLNQDQINMINSLGKEIILVPDRDKEGEGLFNTAIEQGWSISIPPWNRGVKDVGDATQKYGRILTLKTIIDNRDKNSFNSKLKRQMDKF